MHRPASHYLMVAAFVALLVTPPAISGPVLGVALGVRGTLWAVRLVRRLRQAAADGRAGGGVNIGIGERGRRVHLDDHQLSAHGLILGASGSGKTTTLLRILSERIGQGHPVVALDMKGSPEFAARLGAAAAAAGRSFMLWTPDGPRCWNPLAHGNPTELKDKLIASERFTEPHYQRAAERYLQTTLRVLQELRPERPPVLSEVVALLEPARLSALLRSLPFSQSLTVSDYLATLGPDQLSAVRGLATRLAIITESHTGRFLMPSPAGAAGGAEIDLHAALRGDAVVLFSLNSSSYGKLAAQLGTLVVQDLIGATGQRLHDTAVPAAMVAIDEFSALGADQVLALFARARESGVSVVLATQELADLERAAPGLRDQVLGNTAVKIAHRQDVPVSAQTIAQMAGTEKRWEVTEQLPGGGLAPGLGLGGRARPRSLGTRREVEQFVVHPNEIKRLRTGEAVLITKLPHMQVRKVQVTPASPPGVVQASAPGGVQASTPAPPEAVGGRGKSSARRREPSRGRGELSAGGGELSRGRGELSAGGGELSRGRGDRENDRGPTAGR